jgi:hypothetical protein
VLRSIPTVGTRQVVCFRNKNRCGIRARRLSYAVRAGGGTTGRPIIQKLEECVDVVFPEGVTLKHENQFSST